MSEPQQSPVDAMGVLVEKFFTTKRGPVTSRDLDLLGQGKALNLSSGLAATSWGQGPTVLLAHGWNSRRSHWGLFIPELIAQGFRVVAFDAPAHGDSAGTKVNVLKYGRALMEVSREVGPVFGVIGHSFGAAAIVVAIKLGMVVDRAVLISGPGSLLALIERWARAHHVAESEIPTFVELTAQEVGVPVTEFDLIAIAANHQTPALIIHDRSDDEIPVEEAVALAHAWPGAKLRLTERLGHRRILIAKTVVGEVMAFLVMS